MSDNFLIEFKEILNSFYKELNDPSSKINARSLFNTYQEIIDKYDKYHNQQFNSESWIVRNKSVSEPEKAIENMIDDIREIHQRLYGEYYF